VIIEWLAQKFPEIVGLQVPLSSSQGIKHTTLGIQRDKNIIHDMIIIKMMIFFMIISMNSYFTKFNNGLICGVSNNDVKTSNQINFIHKYFVDENNHMKSDHISAFCRVFVKRHCKLLMLKQGSTSNHLQVGSYML